MLRSSVVGIAIHENGVVLTTEVGEAQAAKYGRTPEKVFDTKGVDHSPLWGLQWLSGSKASPDDFLFSTSRVSMAATGCQGDDVAAR